jgi:hypothetical protein
MQSYSVNCPKCKAVLKSTKPIRAGIKLKCPKCQSGFVTPETEDDELVEPEVVESTAVQSTPPRKHARAAADDLDEVDELEDVEEIDDDEESRPRKRRRPRDDDDDEPKARKKRPKKKKKKSKSNAGLIIGLSAGAGVLLIGVVVAIFLLMGGGSTVAQHEAAIQEMLVVVNDFAAVLESVKDRNSAQAAAPRIRELTVRFQQTVEKAKALPKVTAEQDADLQEKFMPEFSTAMQRMQRAGMSAGFASGGEPTFIAALHELEKVGRSMPQLGR